MKKVTSKKLSSTDFELTFLLFYFCEPNIVFFENPRILCLFQIYLITCLDFWKSQKMSSKSVELPFFGATFFGFFLNMADGNGSETAITNEKSQLKVNISLILFSFRMHFEWFDHEVHEIIWIISTIAHYHWVRVYQYFML